MKQIYAMVWYTNEEPIKMNRSQKHLYNLYNWGFSSSSTAWKPTKLWINIAVVNFVAISVVDSATITAKSLTLYSV